MPNNSPWKMPPGPERRRRLRLLDVAITAEDYTPEELAAMGTGATGADVPVPATRVAEPA